MRGRSYIYIRKPFVIEDLSIAGYKLACLRFKRTHSANHKSRQKSLQKIHPCLVRFSDSLPRASGLGNLINPWSTHIKTKSGQNCWKKIYPSSTHRLDAESFVRCPTDLDRTGILYCMVQHVTEFGEVWFGMLGCVRLWHGMLGYGMVWTRRRHRKPHLRRLLVLDSVQQDY